MSKVVFILGAGASKEAGAPVMKDFLNNARDLLASGSLNPAEKPHFERVFEAIAKLQKIHSKASLDLDNIESIFRSFVWRLEMQIDDELFNESLVESLKILIKVTLEKTIKIKPCSSPTINFSAILCYDKLVRLITKKREKVALSILTFNYDLAIDYSLHYHNTPFSYCLNSSQEEISLLKPHEISLLKLHGSLNWFLCSNCKKVYFVDMKAVKESLIRKYSENVAVEDCHLKVQNSYNACCKITQDNVNSPFIVPPVDNKNIFYANILPVWQKAHQELSTAERIYVFGYSLPKTDMFFENLYAHGTLGDTLLREIKVFDPDPMVEKRFKKLLGPGARSKFTFIEKKFGDAVNSLDKENWI